MGDVWDADTKGKRRYIDGEVGGDWEIELDV